jgi:hypothetical protein
MCAKQQKKRGRRREEKVLSCSPGNEIESTLPPLPLPSPPLSNAERKEESLLIAGAVCTWVLWRTGKGKGVWGED